MGDALSFVCSFCTLLIFNIFVFIKHHMKRKYFTQVYFAATILTSTSIILLLCYQGNIRVHNEWQWFMPCVLFQYPLIRRTVLEVFCPCWKWVGCSDAHFPMEFALPLSYHPSCVSVCLLTNTRARVSVCVCGCVGMCVCLICVCVCVCVCVCPQPCVSQPGAAAADFMPLFPAPYNLVWQRRGVCMGVVYLYECVLSWNVSVCMCRCLLLCMIMDKCPFACDCI